MNDFSNDFADVRVALVAWDGEAAGEPFRWASPFAVMNGGGNFGDPADRLFALIDQTGEGISVYSVKSTTENTIESVDLFVELLPDMYFRLSQNVYRTADLYRLSPCKTTPLFLPPPQYAAAPTAMIELERTVVANIAKKEVQSTVSLLNKTSLLGSTAGAMIGILLTPDAAGSLRTKLLVTDKAQTVTWRELRDDQFVTVVQNTTLIWRSIGGLDDLEIDYLVVGDPERSYNLDSVGYQSSTMSQEARIPATSDFIEQMDPVVRAEVLNRVLVRGEPGLFSHNAAEIKVHAKCEGQSGDAIGKEAKLVKVFPVDPNEFNPPGLELGPEIRTPDNGVIYKWYRDHCCPVNCLAESPEHAWL